MKCGTCAGVCPARAITMGADLYPELDSGRCIVTRMEPDEPWKGEAFIARTLDT